MYGDCSGQDICEGSWKSFFCQTICSPTVKRPDLFKLPVEAAARIVPLHGITGVLPVPAYPRNTIFALIHRSLGV